MISHYLLDTCACLWMTTGQKLKHGANDVLSEGVARGARLCVSPATAWEVGMLASKGRVAIKVDPMTWFKSLLSLPGARLVKMPPSILVASSFLPGAPPADPGDRLMAATARAFNMVLVTRDRPLLSYADAGHLQAIEC